jgi:hypothetical protein
MDHFTRHPLELPGPMGVRIMNKMLWSVCLSAVLMLSICNPAVAQKTVYTTAQKVTYTTTMTSGPFPVVSTARAVNCAVVNNDTDVVKLRVTLFKLRSSFKEQVALIDFDLPPGGFRNAEWVSNFVGSMYEVVVEATSDEIHPNVTQSDDDLFFIPGTLISAGEFVGLKIKSGKH